MVANVGTKACEGNLCHKLVREDIVIGNSSYHSARDTKYLAVWVDYVSLSSQAIGGSGLKKAFPIPKFGDGVRVKRIISWNFTVVYTNLPQE